jgi:Na+-translocating ferredoxin:NAD+ oxidoreductase RnfC subunit
MSDQFCWHIELPAAETYAKRAEECRRLAQVCPEHLRESYLELAAEYEQLAKQAEKSAAQSVQRASHDKED